MVAPYNSHNNHCVVVQESKAIRVIMRSVKRCLLHRMRKTVKAHTIREQLILPLGGHCSRLMVKNVGLKRFFIPANNPNAVEPSLGHAGS